ncbi:hypothetical protein KI387_042428 [Taxus chinensis]|uniref:Pentatricopeptide repeat-containing protein n=1 Tax=Taxus chinensis TaxID=29808 RepID=A0AA38C0Y6_TAXCH|nr:hypothetical protein KI387_042428 [Taxus chinensis]
MAKRLVRHTMRKIAETYSTKLLRSTANSSSKVINSIANSTFQGTQQSSNPFDRSFSISSAKNSSDSFHNGPALCKFSTKVEQRENKAPQRTAIKSKNLINHKSRKNTRNYKIPESKFSQPGKDPKKPESKLSESVKNSKKLENPEAKFSESEKKSINSQSKLSESEKNTKNPENPENPKSKLLGSGITPQTSESKVSDSEIKIKIPTKREKPEPKLSDCEKLCSILNGDIALDDVVDKLEETAIEMNSHLLDKVIRKSDNAGRKALLFYKWAVQQPGCKPNLDIFNALIDYFGRKNDFKAVESLLKENRKGLKVDLKTFEIAVKSLVKAGREKKTVEFFHRMGEHGFKQDVKAQKIVVRELSDAGFASYAEKLVKEKADVYYPDEEICNMLVKGWCVAEKLDEAKRMVNEMSIGRFAMDAMAYNALLDCVCKLCLEKDPFRLMTEAKKILLQMAGAGVPRNEETFNVLITHLCQIRKTSDAMRLFEEMVEYGCSPNLKTYVVLIRSLFLAARVAEGHEMLEKMKEAGFKAGERDYFEFIKVLCDIHRVEHAHVVFLTMKGNGYLPRIETHALLIRNLSGAGHTDKAQKLFDEAVESKIIPSTRTDLLEQSKVEEPLQEKKKKTKKLTLGMKRKKKNLKLKKIRLSFVKKPRKPKMM